MPRNDLLEMLSPENIRTPRIKVIGLGGAGCNTIQRLSRLNMPDIQLVSANTDSQALTRCQAGICLLLGKELTGGLGAGGNPEIGKQAAEESCRELLQVIQGADFLFLTAGMGGGTGSGAIQIAARMAKSLDIPAIGMVTLPFAFESGQRARNAAEAASCLQPFVDTLITIPNDRLLSLCTRETRLDAALALADDILVQGILGISGLIRLQGRLTVDLSHILRLMRGQSGTFIATARRGPSSNIIQAIRDALRHPLLDGISIQDANGVIIKFSGDISIAEITLGLDYLKSLVPEDTEIITAVDDERHKAGEASVMLLITGIGAQPLAFPESDPKTDSQKEATPYSTPGHDDLKPVVVDSTTDEEDLTVPAFIRRGYNLVNAVVTDHAARDHRTN